MTLKTYKFGLNDCKIATWTAVESYGAAVDVPSIQLMGVEYNTESGQLEGDDIITDAHAKVQSMTCRIRFGFKDLDVIAVLTGVTVTDSTTVSESFIMGRQNMPYFAMCGRVDSTEGGGDMHIFIPKCKLMEGFGLSLEKGRYITPEITALAVYEGATYGMSKVIEHGTAADVVIPPV